MYNKKSIKLERIISLGTAVVGAVSAPRSTDCTEQKKRIFNLMMFILFLKSMV
jgi:hypothetical protein